MSIWAAVSLCSMGLGGFFYLKSDGARQRAKDVRNIKVFTDWKALEDAVDKSEGRGIYTAARGRLFACNPVETTYASDGYDNDLPGVVVRVVKSEDTYAGSRGRSYDETQFAKQIQLAEDWDLAGPKVDAPASAPLAISRRLVIASNEDLALRPVYTGFEPAYSILSDLSGYNVTESMLPQHSPVTIIGHVNRFSGKVKPSGPIAKAVRHAARPTGVTEANMNADRAAASGKLLPGEVPARPVEANEKNLNKLPETAVPRLKFTMPADGKLSYVTNLPIERLVTDHERTASIYLFFTIFSAAFSGFCGYKAVRGWGWV